MDEFSSWSPSSLAEQADIPIGSAKAIVDYGLDRLSNWPALGIVGSNKENMFFQRSVKEENAVAGPSGMSRDGVKEEGDCDNDMLFLTKEQSDLFSQDRTEKDPIFLD